jgi:hypothetical protein
MRGAERRESGQHCRMGNSSCEALAWATGIAVLGGGIFVPSFLWFIGYLCRTWAPTPRSKIRSIGKVVPHTGGFIERSGFAVIMYAMPGDAPIAMGGLDGVEDGHVLAARFRSHTSRPAGLGEPRPALSPGEFRLDAVCRGGGTLRPICNELQYPVPHFAAGHVALL